MKKVKKKSVIPYALVNNAYASLILPKLKRFKYDHDKIVKPKPDIYINIKSDEIINNYYNLPNNISLNGAYQAALYKIDIETIDIHLDEYEVKLYTLNLEDDFNNYKEIMKELEDFKVNINDYKITDLPTDTALTLEYKNYETNINEQKSKLLESINKNDKEVENKLKQNEENYNEALKDEEEIRKTKLQRIKKVERNEFLNNLDKKEIKDYINSNLPGETQKLNNQLLINISDLDQKFAENKSRILSDKNQEINSETIRNSEKIQNLQKSYNERINNLETDLDNKSTAIRKSYESSLSAVNLKLKEIKSISDTLVKNNQFVNNERNRIDTETRNEKSRYTLLNINDIAKLKTDYKKPLLDTMINNTNIQFDKIIKGLDNLNRTAKKNLEIEYRDKHYTSLVNYINNNTKNKVPKLKDKISDHIKNLEKLLQQENVKLQGEVVSLNDNMNKEINNQDEHKQIYDLRIELKNEIDKENENLNNLIHNNKTSVKINDLEILYTLNKNNQESANETAILNLPNILAEKYIDTAYEIFKNKQNNLINSIEGTKRLNDKIFKDAYEANIKTQNEWKEDFAKLIRVDIENLENELKIEKEKYDSEVDKIRRLRDSVDTKNQKVNTKISDKQDKLNNLIDKFVSKIYIDQLQDLIKDLDILTLKKPIINQNQTYNPTISVYKEIPKLIDYLKNHFQFFENINSDILEYEFMSFGNNYLWKIEANFKNPYVNFENLTDKLKINLYYPKINLIHPIYCDFIHNNVSNNNVLAYINIKNKHFTESISEIENISYFKVTQSNINRIKIYFSGELNKIIEFLNIKYFITIHLKPL